MLLLIAIFWRYFISNPCSMNNISICLPIAFRYMQLKGNPWSIGEEGADLEDALCAENLTLSLIACLARAQFKLQISINMDKATRVFFFIKDPQGCREVRLPTFCGVGLGEKDGLYVYRPTITRTQTSFFRSR